MMTNITKKKLIVLLKIIFSLSLIIWFFSCFQWADFISVLRRAQISWIFYAVLWIVISLLVSIYKWGSILKALGISVPYRVLWQSYWAGIFFNNFLPSSIGGDGFRIYHIGKHTGNIAGSTASVVVERLLATLGLALSALISSNFVTFHIPYLLSFFTIVALVSFFLLLIIFSPAFLILMQKTFSRVRPAVNFFQILSQHGDMLRKNKELLYWALGWSIIFQWCVVMVNYMIFKALAIDQVGFFDAALIIPATSVAAMIPVGINGYGTREGAYIALLDYLKVSGPEAMTVSITFALLVTIASIYGGWVLMKGHLFRGMNHGDSTSGKSGKLFFRGI